MATTPFILYTNKLETASSITVTSEATGFEKENAYDWHTWDFWKANASGTVYYTVDMGSATSMDAWGIAAHDLGINSATILLQYSATGSFGGEEVDVGSAVSPTASEPILKTFSSVSARYWRWKIVSASTASKIGVLMLGPRLSMLKGLRIGYKPDLLAQQFETNINLSVDAAMLGADVYKKPVMATMKFTLLTPAWTRANWEPFIRHVEQGKGFLYQPDPDNNATEVTYGKAQKKIPAPNYSHNNFMTVSLLYIGIVS